MRKNLNFLWFALALLAQPLYGETTLPGFLEERNIELRWHPFRQTGVLVKNDKRVVFSPEDPWILIDYKERIKCEPLYYREGTIYLPETTVKKLDTIFSEPAGENTTSRIAAILIDPGHGGKDPGAIGAHTVDGEAVKIREKDVVLKVSVEIYRMLSSKYPDKDVLLTRTGDTFPSLEDRVEMANQVQLKPHEAVIFVSIHANASLNKKSSGFEVWYLPPEYRRDLLEPESVEGEHEEILPILNTMLEEEYTVESILLAKNILNELDGLVGDVSPNRGLKEEIWFVVRKAKMPSVLVELGFVTNMEEGLRLKDDGYLKKLSLGIYNGISSFIDQFERTGGFTTVQ